MFTIIEENCSEVITKVKNVKLGADLFDKANRVAFMGKGGNLAIAQHAASDVYRHTGKFTFAPDSVNTTAIAEDGLWFDPWVAYAQQNCDLLIAITCRLNSPITKALEDNFIENKILLIAPQKHLYIPTIEIETKTYHEFEVTCLWTIYRMMEYNGLSLPTLP
jgi:phosphoheptose isomerase